MLKDDGEDRREFLRAIDAVKKRTQRAKRYVSAADEPADRRAAAELNRHDIREEIDRASRKVLSDRQLRILKLTTDGWSIPEIADALATTVERVRDEKYKAIRKLQKELVTV